MPCVLASVSGRGWSPCGLFPLLPQGVLSSSVCGLASWRTLSGEVACEGVSGRTGRRGAVGENGGEVRQELPGGQPLSAGSWFCTGCCPRAAAATEPRAGAGAGTAEGAGASSTERPCCAFGCLREGRGVSCTLSWGSQRLVVWGQEPSCRISWLLLHWLPPRRPAELIQAAADAPGAALPGSRLAQRLVLGGLVLYILYIRIFNIYLLKRQS